jgi:hypothetical protein
MEVPKMETNRYQTPGTLIWIAIVLLLNAWITGMVMGDEPHGYHARPSAYVMADPARGAAYLTLYRRADLGHNVFVKLWIDGERAGSLIYGHTFETYLSPGRHILWMAPSPNPKWMTPSEVEVDVRRNRVYNYTVTSNHSGSLILKSE